MGYKVFLITPYFRTLYNNVVMSPNEYYVDRELLYNTIHGKLSYYIGNSFILPIFAQTPFPSIIVLPSPIFKANVAIIKKLHKAPVLVDFGDIYFSRNDPLWYIRFSTKYLAAILTKYADYVVLPTKKMLTLFRKMFPQLSKKLIHIPSSIDTEIFTPLKKTPHPTIAFIGSLSYGRGAELLPAIIRKVIKYYDETQFTIAGSGSLKGFLEKQIKAMQLERHVNLVGNVNFLDIPKIFGDHWIGLSLYPRETIYPVDVLKALAYMSLGMPIVSFTHIEEAEEVSIRVAPYDVDRYIQAILNLIGNEELRRSLSQRARHTAISRYEIRVVAREYHILLNSLEASSNDR